MRRDLLLTLYHLRLRTLDCRQRARNMSCGEPFDEYLVLADKRQNSCGVQSTKTCLSVYFGELSERGVQRGWHMCRDDCSFHPCEEVIH